MNNLERNSTTEYGHQNNLYKSTKYTKLHACIRNYCLKLYNDWPFKSQFNDNREEFCSKVPTCANGDTRGLMPPSRSICATVHAILSSLITRKMEKTLRPFVHWNTILDLKKNKWINYFKVSPPRIAAKNRQSGFNANLHCQKYNMNLCLRHRHKWVTTQQ